MQTAARGWEQSTCGLGAWRLGPGPGLLPPGLLPPALLGGRRKQLVRKLRGGRKGAESEEGSRVPVAWRLGPGPRLLPPGLLGGRLETAAGQVRRAAANLQVLRRRQALGAPPPPTFRCAAALSSMALSESQLTFFCAGHVRRALPPRGSSSRAGRAFPRAPPALRYGVVFYP